MSDTQSILDAITRHQEKSQESFDKIRHEVNEKFDKIREDFLIFEKRTTELGVHLDEAKTNIQKFEKILNGNGTPGLKIQVEMLDQSLQAFKQNIKDFNEQQQKKEDIDSKVKINENKNSTQVKIAVITSTLSFLTIIIKTVVELFM